MQGVIESSGVDPELMGLPLSPPPPPITFDMINTYFTSTSGRQDPNSPLKLCGRYVWSMALLLGVVPSMHLRPPKPGPLALH